MQYRTLGGSGLVVSAVGLGCNNFGKTLDLEASRAVCHAALDAGVTLFDTGDTYGRPEGSTTPHSEAFLGEILEDHRSEVILATKFGNDMFGENGPDWGGGRASRRYIRLAVERSLRQLRTEHIDLYQLHNQDPHTPIEETLDVLTDLVREGKIGYLGSSNFAAWQIADAECTARARGLQRFVSTEVEYSLLKLDAEREIIPACEHYDIGLLPYFPLAHGLLTGKYTRDSGIPAGSRLDTWDMPGYLTERRLAVLDRLRAFAADRSVSLLSVAIGALAANPVVGSVIAGATQPEQVAQNADAISWRPAEHDLDQLRAIVSS